MLALILLLGTAGASAAGALTGAAPARVPSPEAAGRWAASVRAYYAAPSPDATSFGATLRELSRYDLTSPEVRAALAGVEAQARAAVSQAFVGDEESQRLDPAQSWTALQRALPLSRGPLAAFLSEDERTNIDAGARLLKQRLPEAWRERTEALAYTLMGTSAHGAVAAPAAARARTTATPEYARAKALAGQLASTFDPRESEALGDALGALVSEHPDDEALGRLVARAFAAQSSHTPSFMRRLETAAEASRFDAVRKIALVTLFAAARRTNDPTQADALVAQAVAVAQTSESPGLRRVAAEWAVDARAFRPGSAARMDRLLEDIQERSQAPPEPPAARSPALASPAVTTSPESRGSIGRARAWLRRLLVDPVLAATAAILARLELFRRSWRERRLI